MQPKNPVILLMHLTLLMATILSLLLKLNGFRITGLTHNIPQNERLFCTDWKVRLVTSSLLLSFKLLTVITPE